MGTNIATLATDAPPVVLGDTLGKPPAAMVDTGEPDLSESALIAGGHLNEDGTPLTTEPAAVASVSEAAPAEAPAKPDDAPEAEPKPEDVAKPEEAKKPASPIETALRQREKTLVQRQMQLSKEKTEHAATVQATQAQLRQYEAQIVQAQQIIELATKSPMEILLQAGWTPEIIAERYFNGNRPGPNETQRAYDARIAQLEQTVAAERQERVRERTAREVSETYAGFTSLARSDGARWPLGSQLSEARLIRDGDRIADEMGTRTSMEEVLDKLEDELSEVANLPKSRNGKPAARPAKPAPRVREPPPPTLTAAAAAERASDDAWDPLLATEEAIAIRTAEEIETISKAGGRR